MKNLNWAHVIEGWKNHLIPRKKVAKLINSTSLERLSICKDCPLSSSNKVGYESIRIDYHCTVCGCTLAALTKCLSCCCEEGKWLCVLTPEEEEELKNGKG